MDPTQDFQFLTSYYHHVGNGPASSWYRRIPHGTWLNVISVRTFAVLLLLHSGHSRPLAGLPFSQPVLRNPFGSSNSFQTQIRSNSFGLSNPSLTPIHSNPFGSSNSLLTPKHSNPFGSSYLFPTLINSNPFGPSNPSLTPINSNPFGSSNLFPTPIDSNPFGLSNPSLTPINSSPFRSSDPSNTQTNCNPVGSSKNSNQFGSHSTNVLRSLIYSAQISESSKPNSTTYEKAYFRCRNRIEEPCSSGASQGTKRLKLADKVDDKDNENPEVASISTVQTRRSWRGEGVTAANGDDTEVNYFTNCWIVYETCPVLKTAVN